MTSPAARSQEGGLRGAGRESNGPSPSPIVGDLVWAALVFGSVALLCLCVALDLDRQE